MSMHRIEATQVLPITIEEAWRFFADPRNLVRITPPDMHFRITSLVPERIYAGLIVTYTLRPLLGLPLPWVTEITHIEEGKRFVDEQRMGPYRLWHHEHELTSVPGGVELRDVVHYALPFGPLDDVVHALGIGRRVRRIFDYRREVLSARFGGAAVSRPAAASGNRHSAGAYI